MAKTAHNFYNDSCPQSLFLYGTKREDSTPNFGLFCWFSYINVDSEGGPRKGVFSMRFPSKNEPIDFTD